MNKIEDCSSFFTLTTKLESYTLYIVKVEWDQNKDRANSRKHGVSFEEARSVFHDAEALLIPDPDNSDEEDRFIILGLSSKLRELIVSFCERMKQSE